MGFTYDKRPDFWSAIYGFFDFEDLYDNLTKRALDGEVVVEIGSFLGRSACYWGQQIKDSGKKITLLCVDVWPSTYKVDDGGVREIEAPFETFVANVRQCGLSDIVVPLRVPSIIAATFVRNNLASVFIDGDHSYEACREDILAWLPKVKRGGVLAGHDHSDTFPGVKKATEELFGTTLKFVSKQCWYVDIL